MRNLLKSTKVLKALSCSMNAAVCCSVGLLQRLSRAAARRSRKNRYMAGLCVTALKSELNGKEICEAFSSSSWPIRKFV